MSLKKIYVAILLVLLLLCLGSYNIYYFYNLEKNKIISSPEIERIEFINNSTKEEILLNSKKIPVLLYHHISDEVINDMIVSPNNFESHMKAIHDNGYYTLSIDDIINYIENGKEIPEKSILITFDDGYYSNYEYAYPILKKYKLKATIFVIGAFFGLNTYKNTNHEILPYIGFKEKNQMKKSNLIDFECHTYDLHQIAFYENEILSKNIYENILIKPEETMSEYEKRLINDCNEWTNLLGSNIKAYAYPHGKSDLLSLTILNKIGVKVTFNTMARTDIIIKNNPISGYNLGRYTITENYTANDVINLLMN